MRLDMAQDGINIVRCDVQGKLIELAAGRHTNVRLERIGYKYVYGMEVWKKTWRIHRIRSGYEYNTEHKPW